MTFACAIVENLAHGTGFSDQSHLTRPFRRLIGVTPGEIGIIHDSPASGLGVHPGDKIVTVDGKNATQLGGGGMNTLFRQKVGTKVTLAIQSGAGLRTVTLSL